MGPYWRKLFHQPAGLIAALHVDYPSYAVKSIGYWRRYYRRYGYPVPYAYFPPADGYYVPPAAYAYPPATSYAPAPEADYGDSAPSEGEYNDEGNYPQEGDYAGAPPPEGY